MKKTKLGIIAGTPFDTKLGAEYYRKKGIDVISDNISVTPAEQNILQYQKQKKLEKIVVEKIKKLKAQNVKQLIIYCNSLSAVLDIDKIMRLTGVNIITPLLIYEKLEFNKIDKLAILAANSQSAARIEKIILNNNQKLEFITAGIIPVINAIELEIKPEIIVEDYGLRELLISFKKMGAGQLLLGCTHLPYLKKELESIFTQIIDPAAEMLRMFKQNHS